MTIQNLSNYHGRKVVFSLLQSIHKTTVKSVEYTHLFVLQTSHACDSLCACACCPCALRSCHKWCTETSWWEYEWCVCVCPVPPCPETWRCRFGRQRTWWRCGAVHALCGCSCSWKFSGTGCIGKASPTCECTGGSVAMVAAVWKRIRMKWWSDA